MTPGLDFDPISGGGWVRFSFAGSTEDVAETVKLCAAHKVPVIAYGTGTSLEGQVAALRGGVCIDLMQMNKVLRVSVEDLDVTVEPGVTRKQLNAEVFDRVLESC